MMNNKKWSVGSLIPGKEAMRAPINPPVYSIEEKQVKQVKKDTPAEAAVRWKQKETSCTVPVTPGLTLLDGALQRGCSIDYKCRKGTCGRCTVDIVSGTAFLSPKNEAEKKKLGSSLQRLACQSVMRSN